MVEKFFLWFAFLGLEPKIGGTMSERKIETAVLGLGDEGRLLLKAASESEYFRIQAVADKDGGLAEKLAGEYGCAWYDDYRQVLSAMDSRLEEDETRCLIVGEGLYICEEYVRLAMKKRFNVLKVAPGGRDFEESAELVRLAEDEGVKFAIANPRRYAKSFGALHEYIKTGVVDDIFLVAGFFCYAGVERAGWQKDPKLAGGGVLVHNSFGMIDQLMWNFPIPQQVYSLMTNNAADKQQRLSLTEDTAVIAMKFSDRFVGNVVVSSRSSVWPRQEFVKVCGKDRILIVNDRQLTMRDGESQLIEEIDFEADEFSRMAGVVGDFGRIVLHPDEGELCSSGRENLKSMALIESAYLSARTGMPEEPGRILQMGQFDAGDIDAGDF